MPDDQVMSDEAMAQAMAAEMAAEMPEAPGVADFGEIQGEGIGLDPASLSVLSDLTMPVAIELGRTRMSVQDILALGRGSVIQLERLAGEPIDVFVGDRRFAEGEVVVVGEQFGVRVTRILHSVRSPDSEAAA